MKQIKRAFKQPLIDLIEPMKDGQKFTSTELAKIVGNCEASDLSNVLTDLKNEGLISLYGTNSLGNVWQKGQGEQARAFKAFLSMPVPARV